VRNLFARLSIVKFFTVFSERFIEIVTINKPLGEYNVRIK
jgi:hypothetical protein